MVHNTKWEHKRRLKQLRPRFTEDVTAQEEVQMDVLYDTFDIPIPTPEMVVPRWSSKRKRKQIEPLSPDPKRKKKLFPKEIILRRKCCREELIALSIRMD